MTDPRSGRQLTITARGYRAEIASIGATLRALTFEGRDLVIPFDADEVRPAHRGATLAPWPNRIVDGRFTSLLTHPSGLVTIVGILLLGAMGIVLAQVSLQVGALAATLPANLSTDPAVAVVLGIVLLDEHITHTQWNIAGYAVCAGFILVGNIRLAAPTASRLAH